MKVLDSATVLLVLTGTLLGLTFPLGKLSHSAGISPVIWAWLISAGSAACLLAICLAFRRAIPYGPVVLRYYVVLAAISLIVPNLLTFFVIPQLGSGFTGLMFTLSPVFTLALSFLWQVRVPNALGMFGIALGFIGALMVALTRGEVGQPASLFWVVLGLCIPLSLAFGNLYRTMAWPEGENPLALATGSNLAAAVILLLIIGLDPTSSLPGGLITHATISVPAVITATAMFTVFFRLQQLGGPTYLSQIGYVAAAVALLVGTVFLSERYSLLTWSGAAVIVLAILVSVRAQRAVTSGPV